MSTGDESERDTLALTGLRRMVLHARDGLDATVPVPVWSYDSQAWKPIQVQRHAAHLLAIQVLTLVADCIPSGEPASANGVAPQAEEETGT